MRNYRIAFFTADWNYELVESTLQGLKKYIQDHENVSVCVFDCFGKDNDTAKDRSEYAIFNLPDLNQFDGLLVQGSQIVLNPIREEIARRVARVGIPAVSIDCPIEGCAMVGIDNRHAQRDITEHLLKDHGVRRLVYLTGLMDNGCPEAPQRLEGFLSACREYGVPKEDVEVIECTWRTTDGIDVGRRWLQERRPLPEAFVCANDEMALGLISALREGGRRVPEDVRVTGFDNVSSAELSSPRLSTIHRDYMRINYQAMEVLINRINGTDMRETVPMEYGVICSESCGCGEAMRPGYIRDKYFQQIRFLKDFYMLQDQMAEALFDTSSLLQLMDIVSRSRQIFGCERVYLCVNDYYFDNYDKNQRRFNTEVFGKEMILSRCDPDSAEPDGSHEYTRFPTRRLLPDELLQRDRFLVFYPLHYNTYSIGYLVMNDISEAAKLNLHKSLFSFMEIAIENVRKKGLLHKLNDVLDNLYVHDALTGLYNRFGYERFGQQSFESFLTRDGSVQVVFVDMDDMKGINDRLGHELGDAAIRSAAQVLQEVCASEDFLMRYGGDEFLLVVSGEQVDLPQAIRSAVAQWNRNSEMPFTLSLSIGVVRADTGRRRTLDECVQEADAQMYESKRRRRFGLPK